MSIRSVVEGSFVVDSPPKSYSEFLKRYQAVKAEAELLRASCNDQFGASVRGRREKAGLSIRAVGRELGVSHVYLSKCETGKHPWSLETLIPVLSLLEERGV